MKSMKWVVEFRDTVGEWRSQASLARALGDTYGERFASPFDTEAAATAFMSDVRGMSERWMTGDLRVRELPVSTVAAWLVGMGFTRAQQRVWWPITADTTEQELCGIALHCAKTTDPASYGFADLVDWHPHLLSLRDEARTLRAAKG